jgi:hypothetical protein
LEELGRVAMLFKPLHELSHLVEIGVELRAVLGAVDGLNLAVDWDGLRFRIEEKGWIAWWGTRPLGVNRDQSTRELVGWGVG